MKYRVIALLWLLLLVACTSCKSGEASAGTDLVPREVQGAWMTDDPQYAERLIKFWPSEFVILTGVESQASVQTVNKVDRQQLGNGFTLTIYSTSRTGSQDQMGLSYSPANGGELRFRNQKQVWRRVSEK